MIKEAILVRVRPANGWLLRVIDSNDKIIISKNFTDAELLALLKKQTA